MRYVIGYVDRAPGEALALSFRMSHHPATAAEALQLGSTVDVRAKHAQSPRMMTEASPGLHHLEEHLHAPRGQRVIDSSVSQAGLVEVSWQNSPCAWI